MKRLIFGGLTAMLQRTADAATTAAIIAPPLTSDKLTELKAKQVANMSALDAEKDFDKKLELMKDGFKISQDIAAEVSAIQKANVAAKLKEANDKKLEFVTNFEAAVLADNTIKANSPDKQASTDALAVLRTELQNMVLGTVAKSATVAGEAKSGAGTKGAKSAEIVALHIANLAAGMTATESKKAIENAGHSRGTTGAVVLVWEKETGLKA